MTTESQFVEVDAKLISQYVPTCEHRKGSWPKDEQPECTSLTADKQARFA
jgi:hypothetical protein